MIDGFATDSVNCTLTQNKFRDLPAKSFNKLNLHFKHGKRAWCKYLR